MLGKKCQALYEQMSLSRQQADRGRDFYVTPLTLSGFSVLLTTRWLNGWATSRFTWPLDGAACSPGFCFLLGTTRSWKKSDEKGKMQVNLLNRLPQNLKVIQLAHALALNIYSYGKSQMQSLVCILTMGHRASSVNGVEPLINRLLCYV